MIYNAIRHRSATLFSWAALLCGAYMVFHETHASGEALEDLRLSFSADFTGVAGLVFALGAAVSLGVLNVIDRRHPPHA